MRHASAEDLRIAAKLPLTIYAPLKPQFLFPSYCLLCVFPIHILDPFYVVTYESETEKLQLHIIPYCIVLFFP